MKLNSAEEIIDDIRQGKIVILMDDEDRENEGDLIVAAQHCTPQVINFMATHGRGLICLTLTRERCEQLELPLMVDRNQAQFGTNFTLSIEAAEGVTTGISAADRATTVRAAVARDAKPEDIVQPGHIFPIMAQDGGVLNRAGHTEAGCDLARLAGLEPAGVIVEILNEDGSMSRRPELEKFAEKHGLKIGTIADLIEYRNNTETTIEQIAQCKLPTQFGEFDLVTFRDTIDGQVHFALKNTDLTPDVPSLVRVHVKDTFADLLGSTRDESKSWTLHKSLERISQEGGVLLLLGKNETPDELIAKVKGYQLQEQGKTLPKKDTWRETSRTVGVGSQILAALNVGKMRLLSSQKKYHSLAGFGLEVVEYLDE
ncbi:bifunctional 3,4-dihydroxy-2-butanone-4-phosphate synthase/GTP cyclohydrolase II [Catenovulum sp. 2E275]|uniref:bifunctional 3,4-dihydroxy-2-butanone-4-phosphate synthase/GTP cyclohydrolase II n=1 Tax=Catenovulum sp. 2E275 TaxID=2980497 RepID=UPI0021CF59C0|nr:bifunctional 3,4-dihydroxy-2-butanone-4-phosphate synthase/GTP cyclohydrolase II [Catenovulum sp. 2E275]MCU4676167.1 bifunctional 3,4-dihydroxy-2-butanone-4-phosphate synthase/GTP cyclohydrolase II [Catenovulum sp. 2E275]